MNSAAKSWRLNETSEVASAPPPGKYAAYEDRFNVDLPDRTWPTQRLRKPPIWCSVDLRDGNQSIPNPMNVEQKITFFKLLTAIGFKEIEIGYPAASRTEREFTCALIEHDLIPDDVTPQVIIAAREDLIRETFACLDGFRRAIVQIYTPTSVAQRKQVFKMTNDQVIASAVYGTKIVRELVEKSGIDVMFQFSPESFTGTEREFARDICNAVIEVWNPRPDEKMTINLPSTVEHSMPNTFADLIEWMNRSLIRRQNITLSIHPHNDRGTAIAASELALLAGAERVEGTLFGNGERAGNVDLVTMALNMFGQGIDPRLSFQNLPHIREVYERCFGLRVPERHPYGGDLAVVAFSGAHQSAIRKGIEHRARSKNPFWDVPYIPVDFKDFGRTYTPIMVNAQSGKNGAAFVLDTEFGCRMPPQMEPVFAHEVQSWCDTHGVVIPPAKLWEVFESNFIKPKGAIVLKSFVATEELNGTKASLELMIGDKRVVNLHGVGKGPIDAVTMALKDIGRNVSIKHFSEHSRGEGADAEAIAYLQIEQDGMTTFGVGIDQNIQSACIHALIAGVNRLESQHWYSPTKRDARISRKPRRKFPLKY